MKYLYEYPTSELTKVMCACGREHNADIPRIVYSDMLTALRNSAYAGHILVVYTADTDSGIFDCLTRDSRWQVSFEELEPYQSTFDKSIDDDVRYILGVGGETVINICKRLAYEHDAYLAVLPVYAYYSAFDGTSRVLREGRLSCSKGKRPDMVIVDYDVIASHHSEYLTGAYAKAVATLGALSDYEYHARLDSEECPHIIKAVRMSLIPVISEGRINNGISRKVTDALIRVEILRLMAGRETSGGEQLMAALYRYLSDKVSDVRSLGENNLYCSIVTGKIYETFLEEYNSAISLPPNRGSDAEKIRRLLKESESRSLIHARAYDEDVCRTEYKLCRVRQQLLDSIRVNNLLMLRGARNVFDSYKDKGYFMRSYIGAHEMMKLVTVAADYSHSDTLLSYVKDTGVLEKLR